MIIINKETLTYELCENKHRGFGVIWTPDEKPKAVVVICHGMCEYAERYSDFAEYLCSNGIAAAGMDHLGHGHTAELLGTMFGYFGGVGSYPKLIENLKLFIDVVKGKIPDTPVILFGHSMGSFISRLFVDKYPNLVNGYIISGTGGTNPLLPAIKRIASATAKIKGERHVSFLTYQLMGKNFMKGIKNPRTPCDWLTRDESVVDAYLSNNYCTFRFTDSAYVDLFTMTEKSNMDSWYLNYPKELPTLIVSGTKDPVGNFGKGPKEVYEKLNSFGAKNVSIKLWEDARHELLNETNKEEVKEYILNWINSLL